MGTKLSEGFLTCMEACDTIELMGGMDFSSLVTNSEELIGAMVTVLETDMAELPVGMLKPIADLQRSILDFFDGRLDEHFDCSAWA